MTNLTDEQFKNYDARIMHAAMCVMQEVFSDIDLEDQCKIYLRALAAAEAEKDVITNEIEEQYKNDDDPPGFYPEMGNVLLGCVGLKLLAGSSKEDFISFGAPHGSGYKFNQDLQALIMAATILSHIKEIELMSCWKDTVIDWTHRAEEAEALLINITGGEDEQPTD